MIDYDFGCLETTRERSPQSQNFADFEAYSRTELPRLVEASLQAIVSTEMAPLEENLRAMLVDIVRRCQSTVAQNYGRIHSPRGGGIARTDFSSLNPRETLLPTSQSTRNQDFGPWLLSTAQSTSTQDSGLSPHEISAVFGRNILDAEGMRDFFEEPPLGNTNLVDNFLDMDSSALKNPHSDSGYGSYERFLLYCECPPSLDCCAGKLHISPVDR